MLKCKVNTNQHEKLIKKWFQLKVMCHIDLEGSGISISRCRRLCLLGRPQRSMLAINWPSLPRLLDSCSSCSSLAPQTNRVSCRRNRCLVMCMHNVETTTPSALQQMWLYAYDAFQRNDHISIWQKLKSAVVLSSFGLHWDLGAVEPWLCSCVGGCNF